MAAELVAGSVAAVAMATVQAADGVVTEHALIVRGQLHNGQELLFHWSMDASDSLAASNFLREYARALDQAADAELRDMLSGGDGP